jgi:hypothetical protein
VSRFKSGGSLAATWHVAENDEKAHASQPGLLYANRPLRASENFREQVDLRLIGGTAKLQYLT